MNPWILILLALAAAIFGLDYLVRRKKWADNSKAEQTSLVVNMFSGGIFAFLSALGILWGLASDSPETAFGEVLYDVTLVMGGTFFIVAIVAVIGSLILRKIGKLKTSIWINATALAYMLLVLLINYLSGVIF